MNKVETFAAAFEGCPSSKLVLGADLKTENGRSEGFDSTFEVLPFILTSGFKNYGEPLQYNTEYYGQILFSYYPWKTSGSEFENDKKIFFNMMKDLTHFYIENRTAGEYSPNPESYRYATCYEITKEEGEMLFGKAQEIIDR